MDRAPERYKRVQLNYDSPAGGRTYRIIANEGNGFYRLQCLTEMAEFETNYSGLARYVTYSQSFSTIAHFSEFDFVD